MGEKLPMTRVSTIGKRRLGDKKVFRLDLLGREVRKVRKDKPGALNRGHRKAKKRGR